MVDWALHTGLYLLGVALVPAGGLLLICWGLWGDRSKGRARCPKCWYDMRGSLPRLACPECGHHAGSERRLYRNRRRRWRAMVGAVLVLLMSYPLTIIGGWYREQAALSRDSWLLDVDDSGQVSVPPVYPRNSECIGPSWLVSLLPPGPARFFHRWTEVEVNSDQGMAMCRRLRHLRTVRVWGKVTDAGLAHLEGLAQLRVLGLSGRQVTDAGLVHLKGLSQLEDLSLTDTQVTGTGLVHLKGLPKLEHLDLRWSLEGHPGVADAGLMHLQGLTQLRCLWLAGTQVTDAGLAHLEGLSWLNDLYLSHTQVTDAGLAHLNRMSQLRHLDLARTQVTDAGLEYLEGLTQMRTLWLTDTQVTDAGVAKLKQALPNVRVVRW